VNHYCDIWFWRASDQAAVVLHLTDRTRMSGEPNAAPRRDGLLRSALLPLLRMGRGWRSSRSWRDRSSGRRPRYGRAVTAVVGRSSTGSRYSTTESGFSDAPSTDARIFGFDEQLTVVGGMLKPGKR
jgi:hypothetical protein